MAGVRATESGKPDVYVVSFPGGEREHRVTSTGGDDPIWSRDGRELYFIAGSRGNERMMAVPIRTHPELTFGTATALFVSARRWGGGFSGRCPRSGTISALTDAF